MLTDPIWSYKRLSCTMIGPLVSCSHLMMSLIYLCLAVVTLSVHLDILYLLKDAGCPHSAVNPCTSCWICSQRSISLTCWPLVCLLFKLALLHYFIIISHLNTGTPPLNTFIWSPSPSSGSVNGAVTYEFNLFHDRACNSNYFMTNQFVA